MNPVATVLLLLGYAVVLPVAVRWPHLEGRRLDAGIVAAQLGLIVAAGGWLVRGRWSLAVAHVVAALVVRWWVRLLR